MTVTIAGSPVDWSDVELQTAERSAIAWVAVPESVSVFAGDPVTITLTGDPLLTAEVADVQRSYRHRRVVAVPPALLDLRRATVDAGEHRDMGLPALLGVALPSAAVEVLPPLDTIQVDRWAIGTDAEGDGRTQGFALRSILRMVRHDGQPIGWRYDARGDRVVIAEPDDDAQRETHEITEPMRWRGAAVVLPASQIRIQGGDLVTGPGTDARRLRLVKIHRTPERVRGIAWLTEELGVPA